MPIKLALIGKPKSGKTTAIIKIINFLKEKGFKVGGFYTIEIKKDEKRIGFDIVDITTGQHGVLARIGEDSGIKVGKYGVRVKDLEIIGVKSLQQKIENFQVVIIDEVGPMELKSNLFRKAVSKLLCSDKPTLFSVHYKSDDFLVQEVKTRSKLYELTLDNREKMTSYLTSELIEFLSQK